MNKRMLHEIAEVQSDTMRENGIYYWFDDADFHKGKALMIGPEGTPYADCPLVFDIVLPNDYPLSNPKVTFMTSDGETRFHPNLYVTGKVCLSILGTWKGPPWTAAITLSKMLLTIQSLLEANPIVNEPSYEGMPLTNPKAKGYAEFVEARLISLTFQNLLRLRSGTCPPIWQEFRERMDTLKDSLLNRLYARIKSHSTETVYEGLTYSMSGTTHWGNLKALAVEAGL